jgi:hypothetical protein
MELKRNFDKMTLRRMRNNDLQLALNDDYTQDTLYW